MQTLKLLHTNNCKINYSIGQEIGFGGADGQVFEISDHKDKVIKISVLYDNFDSCLEDRFKNIYKTLNVLKNIRPSEYARVYEYEYIGKYNRPFYDKVDGQDYILYYYVMEKLNKISEDEKKVFHSILSHEDRMAIKNFSVSKIKKMLNGLSLGLDFDKEKIILFYEALQNSNIKHLDLHPRNIMKDNFGNFKLIDFDRIKILKD